MSKIGPDYNNIIVIYRPKQMIEAQMIIGVLENAGIKIMVREFVAPYAGSWYPFIDLDKALAGAWGEISVHRNEAEKAAQTIQKYLDCLKDSDGNPLEPEVFTRGEAISIHKGGELQPALRILFGVILIGFAIGLLMEIVSTIISFFSLG